MALAESAAAAATNLGAEGITPEARRDIAQAVALAPNDLRVLFLAFQFHFRIGELDHAERFARRRLELAPSNSEHAARALCNLGLIAEFQGQLDDAETLHAQAIAIDRAIGNQLGLARDLGNLAHIPELRGDLDRAEQLARESLAIARTLPGAPAEEIAAGQIANLGDIAKARGRIAEARAMWIESMAMFDRLGVTKWKKDFARRMASLSGAEPTAR